MLGYLFAVIGVCVAFYLGRQQSKAQPAVVIPERVQQALDTLTEGLLIIDEQETILLANRAFSETTGLSSGRITGEKISSLPWVVGPTAKQSNPWTRALAESTPQTDQVMLLQCADGCERYLLINANPIVELDRDARGVLATFRDVTDVEVRREELEKSLAMMRTYRDQISRQNRELQVLASHDPLTCCLNRRAFFTELQPIIGQASSDDSEVACLMVDNDHFKQINDTYGHQVGDDVLRRVAATLRELIGDAGLICRYGGEEFCVILPDYDTGRAAELAESIRSAIEKLRFENPAELQLTVSVGVADRRHGATNEIEIINQADHCLYIAKGNGRNQVVVYDPAVAALPIAPTTKDAHSVDESERIIPFEAVTALVSALAYRDRGTAEHSRRVADLCVQAASGVLDCRSTYILETAAMLHDIGKIGVPDQVLFKPGPLSREEWKLIRQYDRVGAGIVAGTFNCEELNEVIRCFHTPYGYRPNAESEPCGPTLPLAARLLAIADSYDSMRSDRAYRQGRSHEQCIAELRRYAGIQFDPALVEQFAKMIAHAPPPSSQPSPSNQPPQGIPKRTALQIGMQIERLARAIDAKDTDGLRVLAARLAIMAREHRIDAIADAADKLHTAAEDENAQWLRLLDDTQVLLGLCRATQNVFLASRSA